MWDATESYREQVAALLTLVSPNALNKCGVQGDGPGILRGFLPQVQRDGERRWVVRGGGDVGL